MAVNIIPDSIRDVLAYDPETGIFRWKVARGRAKVGMIAGSPNSEGYIQIKYQKVLYKAHRLAYFFVHNEQPGPEVDHIHRDKSDNRIGQLRSTDKSGNQTNSYRTGIRFQRQTISGTTYGYYIATYRRKYLYSGKSILLAWFHRIMAERTDHPVSLPRPHGGL